MSRESPYGFDPCDSHAVEQSHSVELYVCDRRLHIGDEPALDMATYCQDN